ncbi:hypothetical protein M8C21_032584, partial [Ambrosia artemisiifolia]
GIFPSGKQSPHTHTEIREREGDRKGIFPSVNRRPVDLRSLLKQARKDLPPSSLDRSKANANPGIIIINMWIFYLISLPLTTGMVLLTLRYYAGPHTPRYVLFTVGYTWFFSLSFIILVPADIWAAISDQDRGDLVILEYFFTYLVAVKMREMIV